MTGMFRAIFTADDRASESLEHIRQGAVTLNRAMLDTSGTVGGFSEELKGLQGAVSDLGKENKSIVAFRSSLDRVANSGTAAANTLQQLSRRASILAATFAGDTQDQLEDISESLRELGSSMEFVQQETKKTGREFQFLGDVSTDTVFKMRQMSAVGQGLILGMSALDKNVQGLAFSLIFLQFSGALRLSLAFAALTVVGGLVFKQLQKIFELRKEADQMARSLFIITRSTESIGILEDRARGIAEAFGFARKETEEFEKALGQAQLFIRSLGEEPTGDFLQFFTGAFAIALAQGAEYEEALESALTATERFVEDGTREIQNSFGKLVKLDEKEFLSQSTAALTVFREGGPIAVEAVIKAFEHAGVEVPNIVQGLLDRSENGFVKWSDLVEALLITDLPRATQKSIFEMAKGFDEGLELTKIAFDEAFEDIGLNMADHISRATAQALADLDRINQKLIELRATIRQEDPSRPPGRAAQRPGSTEEEEEEDLQRGGSGAPGTREEREQEDPFATSRFNGSRGGNQVSINVDVSGNQIDSETLPRVGESVGSAVIAAMRRGNIIGTGSGII